MSYDLIFWRQQSGEQRPAEVIAKSLLDGEPVSGIHELPVDQIVASVNDRFPLAVAGSLTFWEGGDEGMFELHHSPQHVHFCCRQLAADHCNTLIDVMADFGCPLYDPQVNQRFDGDEAAR